MKAAFVIIALNVSLQLRLPSTQWRLKFKFIEPIHHFIRVGSLFKTNLAALICSTRPPYARNPSITLKTKQKNSTVQ